MGTGTMETAYVEKQKDVGFLGLLFFFFFFAVVDISPWEWLAREGVMGWAGFPRKTPI